MTNKLIIPVFLFCAACSVPDVLEIPPPPGPPAHWSQYSTSTLENSACPDLAGEYLETPVVFRSTPGGQNGPVQVNKKGSYYRHIPLHLADSRELGMAEVNIGADRFLIRQPDAGNLYFVFESNENVVVEDHFKAEEGDFECKSGRLEFPVLYNYGTVEGMSVNFQIRNVMLRDTEGALIVQETIGPYRGDSSTSASDFRYTFLRHAPAKASNRGQK